MARTNVTFEMKLEEFANNSDLNKFNFTKRKEIRFSDNGEMPVWWSTNKRRILGLGNELSQVIKKQYEEYKILIKRNDYDIRLNEFIEIDDLEKFNYTNKEIRFKDGSFVNQWFHANKKKALNNSIIKKQYELYQKSIKERKDDKFASRLTEFHDLDNIDKFDSNKDTIRFKDGVVMGSWFVANFDRIFSQDTQEVKDIIVDYLLYKEIHGLSNKVSYKKRLNDFYKDKHENKYNLKGKQRMFSDGARKGDWFFRHISQIEGSKELRCLIIMRDYRARTQRIDYVEKYNYLIENYDNLSEEEFDKVFSQITNMSKGAYLSFEDKLKEFEEEKDLLKFKCKSNLKFVYGSPMWSWFNHNKDRVLKESKIVRSQYEQYCKTIKNKKNKPVILIDKKHLFAIETNLSKFLKDGGLKFEDGTDMYNWFAGNKNEIFGSTDKDSLTIAKQYAEKEKLVVQRREERFFIKLLEFEYEQNPNKYSTGKNKIVFKDGTGMGKWFYKNHDRLQNMDNDDAINILIDYGEYKDRDKKVSNVR